MSNPRYHPRSVRLWKLGSKCVDDQFLLAPTEDVYTLVMLFLAKMQELYDVELIAFVFMGNHFHIIVRLREDRLPVEHRVVVVALHPERAPPPQEVVEGFGEAALEVPHDVDDAADTAVDYFHANPVRAHLVERVEDYPGVSSWSAYAKDLDEMSHTFFDETAWRRAGALDALRGLYMKTVTVKVSRPPSWDGITASERRAKVRATVARMREEERKAAAERGANASNTPPLESLAKRDPRSRPKHPKPKRRRRKWASGTPEQGTRSAIPPSRSLLVTAHSAPRRSENGHRSAASVRVLD